MIALDKVFKSGDTGKAGSQYTSIVSLSPLFVVFSYCFMSSYFLILL